MTLEPDMRKDAVRGNFSGLRKFFVHITSFFAHCRVLSFGNFTYLWKSYWMIIPQICEITAPSDSIMGEKCGNMDKKIPQSWKISSDSVWTSGSFLMSAASAELGTAQLQLVFLYYLINHSSSYRKFSLTLFRQILFRLASDESRLRNTEDIADSANHSTLGPEWGLFSGYKGINFVLRWGLFMIHSLLDLDTIHYFIIPLLLESSLWHFWTNFIQIGFW